MNKVISTVINAKIFRPVISALALLFIAGCADDLASGNTPMDTTPTGDFELRAIASPLKLVEGDQNGLNIPLLLERKNGHDKSVDLSIAGVTPDDAAFVTSSFTHLTLTPSEDQSEMVLKLAIADLPILPQQREFVITANDGTDSDAMLITVDVEPVDAPDVYLLVGQSNMVGFSGEDPPTREAYPGGLDEVHPRIKQLNVSPNNRQDIFLDAADFTSNILNVSTPVITPAEDPLHIPRDMDNPDGKELEYIGLGLTFAKTALENTSRNIVLVPAAWSGSSFCVNPNAPNGQWNAQPTSNPQLGNTWLFDRAVTRANLALAETGGVLRGILWHQGESDANDRCADSYEDNMKKLVAGFRTRINPDQRGAGLRTADSNIPFIAGTMSRGSDYREDMLPYSEPKLIIDQVHRNLPNLVPHAAVSLHDDLTPANGYPCGNTTCIHFGPEALREMGRRYYSALREAVETD